MPKYEYNGEVERDFPTLGLTAKKGDSFDGPDGLNAPGLSVISSAKSAPAAPAQKENKQQEPSASSDTNAGA